MRKGMSVMETPMPRRQFLGRLAAILGGLAAVDVLGTTAQAGPRRRFFGGIPVYRGNGRRYVNSGYGGNAPRTYLTPAPGYYAPPPRVYVAPPRSYRRPGGSYIPPMM